MLTKLRVIYPNVMKLDYDNRRTRHRAQIDGAEEIQTKSPFAHFRDFYQLQNGQPLSAQQTEFLTKLMEQIWEEEP